MRPCLAKWTKIAHTKIHTLCYSLLRFPDVVWSVFTFKQGVEVPVTFSEVGLSRGACLLSNWEPRSRMGVSEVVLLRGRARIPIPSGNCALPFFRHPHMQVQTRSHSCWYEIAVPPPHCPVEMLTSFREELPKLHDPLPDNLHEPHGTLHGEIGFANILNCEAQSHTQDSRNLHPCIGTPR